MLEWIKKVAEASQYTYGGRRGIKKTKQLMKEADVFVRYRKKYKVTTNSSWLYESKSI